MTNHDQALCEACGAHPIPAIGGNACICEVLLAWGERCAREERERWHRMATKPKAICIHMAKDGVEAVCQACIATIRGATDGD